MVFNTEKMKASMSEEDFALIIDAILNGKYSWACVLVLKNAGYEPGHYIPYRTLNRLIKENGFPSCSSAQTSAAKSRGRSSTKRIRDLSYLDFSSGKSNTVKGGTFAGWPYSMLV
ncbi:MAG: HetP family heterocyst commitment protein [Leptolyngbyaceae cyanobacterium]